MARTFFRSALRSRTAQWFSAAACLVGASLAMPALAAPPTLTCQSDANVFNTGYDGNGGKLSRGAQDAHWEAGSGGASGFSSVSTWAPANVVGNLAPGAWTNSPYGNAEWVARGDGRSDTRNSYVYYRYQFNIDPSVPLDSFALQFDFYIDDQIQQMVVNGAEYKNYVTPASPTGQGGFGSGSRLSENLQNGPTLAWQTGLNSIIIKSWNVVAPTGFLAQIRARATCPPQVTINKTASTTGYVVRGSEVNYTVTASNTGAVPAGGSVVSDPLPAGIRSGSWTCTATGGAACPAGSGTLPLNQTIATFPASSRVTYAITARVADDAQGSITNSATIALPDAITVPPSGTSSVTNAVFDPVAASRPVPGLSQWALWLVSLGLALVAGWGMRRRAR